MSRGRNSKTMDHETRKYLDTFRDTITERLGMVERESTQLRKMFEEDSPSRGAIKFATNQAGTAFLGVLELRKLWQSDSKRRNDLTRLIVAGIAGISLVTVGVTNFISNASAEKSELRARDVVRRENVACETRIYDHEEHLAKRVSEETVKARDIQIDSIIQKKK